MPKYRIEYRTEHSCAEVAVTAASAAKALAKAQVLAEQDTDSLYFIRYDDSGLIEEIVVEDAKGREVAAWRDEQVLLRLAARDLLEAARLVIARWPRGDLAEAVRALSAAVAKAGDTP